MEFSNLFFLYLFLPLCIGIYFLAPGDKLKNGILICFSLLFYCLQRPIYVPLILGLSLFNYFVPKVMAYRKLGMLLSVCLNVGALIFFKIYSGVTFPVGLSFYVFSLIAYQGDMFRNGEECKTFWQFLLFVSFFPKLIMGPITRYSEIAPQMKHRAVDPRAIFYGISRFVFGLSKKILLADPFIRLYDQLGTHSSWISLWGAGTAFMLYIYLEFTGYSDMAIGLGQIFGFTLPENFSKPYTATSVGEFWRRWHITLGSFFRDYVYIPLGGNRKGTLRQIINLLFVWILTGLWHGVSSTFVIWGLYFFVLLSGEKLFYQYICRIPSAVRKMITGIFVYFGWIIFAAKDFAGLGNTIRNMFSFTANGLEPTFLVLRNSSLLFVVGIFVSVLLPVWKDRQKAASKKHSAAMVRLSVLLLGFVILLLLGLCTVSIIGSGAKPSMYAGF